MSGKKKEAAASRPGYSPIVRSDPKELKSFDELARPNAYLNDWTQVATKAKTDKK